MPPGRSGSSPPRAKTPREDKGAPVYRPIVLDGQQQIEAWPSPLEIGRPLPVLPLALDAELVLPIDLEATYRAACQRRRLG
jgi:hypothetical protein